MALARLDVLKKRWQDAQTRYERIVETHAGTKLAPEALYWRYVSEYSRTHDHTILGEAARALRERYPDSVEAVKSSVWAA